MHGVMLSATLPVVGACLGYYQLSLGAKRAKEDVPGCSIGKYTAVSSIMLAVCVMYGFVGAAIIIDGLGKEPAVAGNSALVAGLINGACSAISAVGQGYVSSKAVQAGARQPKIFVGFTLVLIYIEAFALYGLIVSIVSVSVAQKVQLDIASEAVIPFASVFLLATLGGVVGSTASGVAIMDVAVELPELMMKSMLPVVFNGVTGIYGLISAIVDTQPWPPKGNDSAAGILYLMSSVGLAYYGYHGVRALPGNPGSGMVNMILKLISSQSIGLCGLIYGLLVHGSRAGLNSVDVTGSLEPVTLFGKGLATLPAFHVLVLVFLPMLFAFCGAQRQHRLEAPLLA